MLLRASGEHAGIEHDVDGITSTAGAGHSVRDADLLLPFAEAVVRGSAAELWAARERLMAELGAAALMDTAATAAIFNAVVKVADATGIPIEAYKVDQTATARAALGIDTFGQASRPAGPIGQRPPT